MNCEIEIKNKEMFGYKQDEYTMELKRTKF